MFVTNPHMAESPQRNIYKRKKCSNQWKFNLTEELRSDVMFQTFNKNMQYNSIQFLFLLTLCYQLSINKTKSMYFSHFYVFSINLPNCEDSNTLSYYYIYHYLFIIIYYYIYYIYITTTHKCLSVLLALQLCW